MSKSSITVSIVIPMRNEEKYIGRCLESVLANDFPKEEMEILVADGRSNDRSREIVAGFARLYPQIRLIDNAKKIVPPGLNTAIRQSAGRYIVRMDAHSEYPPNYISACVQELSNGTADVVGGRLITRAGAETLSARAIALLSQHPFGVGNSGFRLGWHGRYVDTVPFGAFRREIFDRVGLFREGLVRHQDFEMNARIRRAGGKIFLSPDIFLNYYNLPTIPKMLGRGFRDGLWVGRAWTRYPISFCWRHCAPLALFSGILLPLLLGKFIHGAPIVSLLILGLYLMLMLVSSLQIALRHGLRIFAVLPPLFLAFHAICAVGIVSGLATGFKIPKEHAMTASEAVSLPEAA